jgi:hypothetical protein
MNRRSQLLRLSAVAVLSFTTVARAQGVQQQAPPPAPRAFTFPDTAGAGFDAADSTTAHGSPEDFDFLIGLWHFQFQQRRADGAFNPPFSGHWIVTKKTNANAFVEDIWRADNPTRSIDAGTWTYRVFSPTRKLWTMQGVESESGRWATGIVWSDANNRYAVQNYGSYIMRIRYFDITPTSFKWRADMTTDNGKTWHLDWWSMQATRIGK